MLALSVLLMPPLGMDAMNAKGTGGDAPDKLQNGWLRHELSFGKRN